MAGGDISLGYGEQGTFLRPGEGGSGGAGGGGGCSCQSSDPRAHGYSAHDGDFVYSWLIMNHELGHNFELQHGCGFMDRQYSFCPDDRATMRSLIDTSPSCCFPEGTPISSGPPIIASVTPSSTTVACASPLTITGQRLSRVQLLYVSGRELARIQHFDVLSDTQIEVFQKAMFDEPYVSSLGLKSLAARSDAGTGNLKPLYFVAPSPPILCTDSTQLELPGNALNGLRFEFAGYASQAWKLVMTTSAATRVEDGWTVLDCDPDDTNCNLAWSQTPPLSAPAGSLSAAGYGKWPIGSGFQHVFIPQCDYEPALHVQMQSFDAQGDVAGASVVMQIVLTDNVAPFCP